MVFEVTYKRSDGKTEIENKNKTIVYGNTLWNA